MTDDESYEEILELPPSKRKGVDNIWLICVVLLKI